MKNYSLAVFLLAKECRAVMCSYVPLGEDGQPAAVADRNNGEKPLTMFKTFDPKIKVGDFVVVPTATRHGLTAVKVEQVDVLPDLNSSAQVNWIIGVIGLADFNKIRAQEEDAIKTIKQRELDEERARVSKQFFGDDASGFKELEISKAHGGLVIDQKPAVPAAE